MSNEFHFGFDEFIKLCMAGALAYIIFTLKRFVKSVDNMSKSLAIVLRTIVALVAEHGKNHPDTGLDLSEVMKSMGNKGGD